MFFTNLNFITTVSLIFIFHFHFSFFTEIVILGQQNKISQLASNIKELSRTNQTISALLTEKILNRYEINIFDFFIFYVY